MNITLLLTRIFSTIRFVEHANRTFSPAFWQVSSNCFDPTQAHKLLDCIKELTDKAVFTHTKAF